MRRPSCTRYLTNEHDERIGNDMAQTYDVTSQREVIDLTDPQGSAVKAVEVSFITKPSGVRGTVTVPKVDYTPATAAAAIEAYAAQLEAVHTL